MDDSSSRFWERLTADWVAVLIAAFAIQGLWFGMVSLIVDADPGAAEGLGRASAFLFEFPALKAGQGLPWVLGILGGLVWGVKRALAAGEAPGRHR